ncbi:MAG: CesT family type III secretion system chaperone [Candidatus Competibacteraceae bacterium]
MAGELEKLLRQFARRWGLDEPKPDERGQYFFVLDGNLHITLFQMGNQIYLEGRPGVLPEDFHQTVDPLREILHKHLVGLEKNEEVLSLDPTSDELLLFRRLPGQRLNLADLEIALETFSNQLEFWMRQLSGHQPRLAPPPMHIVFP